MTEFTQSKELNDVNSEADKLIQELEDEGFNKNSINDTTAWCSGSDSGLDLKWAGPTDQSEKLRQKMISGMNSKFG